MNTVAENHLPAKDTNRLEYAVTRAFTLTGLSFLSLQSLHLKQAANRAKKIISDPFTLLTPFSTKSPLEHATDHCPLILFQIQSFSDWNTEITLMKTKPHCQCVHLSTLTYQYISDAV